MHLNPLLLFEYIAAVGAGLAVCIICLSVALLPAILITGWVKRQSQTEETNKTGQVFDTIVTNN